MSAGFGGMTALFVSGRRSFLRGLAMAAALSFAAMGLAKGGGVDFRPFEGLYTGTTYLSAAPNYGVRGTAKIFLVSAKDGRSAALFIQSYETEPDPAFKQWLGNAYVFSKDHTVTMERRSPQLNSGPPTKAKFRWKGSLKALSVRATVVDPFGATVSLRINLHADGRFKSISVRQSYDTTSDGGPVYNYSCDGRVK